MSKADPVAKECWLGRVEVQLCGKGSRSCI